jgi:hypothetical protein
LDLSETKEIVHSTDVEDVNKYLAAGWVLIATASMTTDSREYSNPRILYSLAWTSEANPVKPKLY